jgi:hypothetical protein
MVKMRSLAAAAAAVMVAASAMALDSYYVVTITDMTGGKTYEVMDREQLATLKKQIALEARFFQKALANVQKAWMSPELKDTHQFRWQGQRLKPRTARESQPIASREKADEKASKLMDKALGLDDPKKKTKKTKLSEKEQEKLDKERMRDSEFAELAADVQKEITALAAAAAAK